MKNEINIVLQGGGIKGLAYVGAIRKLEEKYQINQLSGTSVGAIIAGLIAVGYDSFELEAIINKMPYEVLIPKEDKTLITKVKNKGLHSMKNLERFLENLFMLKNKRVFGDIKIGNYYKAIFITTSLNFKRMFILPYDLVNININPDSFPIAKAICMSASLPLFYEPYIINNYMFTDGGVSDNFPKWCFKKGIALKVSKESKFNNFIRKKIFGEMDNKNDIKIIEIDVKEYKVTDFKKGLTDRYILYNRGYKAVSEFLNNGNK